MSNSNVVDNTVNKTNCIPLQKGETVPSDGILIPKKDYEYLTGFEKRATQFIENTQRTLDELISNGSRVDQTTKNTNSLKDTGVSQHG